MYPFNNTPGLVTPPTPGKKDLTGSALVDKLEDAFSTYREDCNNGYCKPDPVVMADFLAKLTAARAALKKGITE